MTKSNIGKEWLFHLTHSVIEERPDRNSSRNLEAGSKAETMEKHCLLAAPYGFLSPLNIAPKTTSLW